MSSLDDAASASSSSIRRVADVLQAALQLLLQASMQQADDGRRSRFRQSLPCRLTFQDSGDRVGGRLTSESRAARQHLEEEAAERPDVGPLVNREASGLLRAHVGRRADDQAVVGSVSGERRSVGGRHPVITV